MFGSGSLAAAAVAVGDAGGLRAVAPKYEAMDLAGADGAAASDAARRARFGAAFEPSVAERRGAASAFSG